MNDFKLPSHSMHNWTLSMISDLIENNYSRARKYDLRVAAACRSKKFYYKYYLGDNIIMRQASTHQKAHYVILEMNLAFHHYLNEKDMQYLAHCENEKKKWAQEIIIKKS